MGKIRFTKGKKQGKRLKDDSERKYVKGRDKRKNSTPGGESPTSRNERRKLVKDEGTTREKKSNQNCHGRAKKSLSFKGCGEFIGFRRIDR